MEKIAGIYKITNTANGKFYIGSSIQIPVRWKEHKSRLKNNNHRNPKLQAAYNKYGQEIFIFEMVEELCNTLHIYEREQYYIDTFNPFYNICKKVLAPPKKCKKINQYNLNGEYVKTWDSIAEAARNCKLAPVTIAHVIIGHRGRKTAGGYIFLAYEGNTKNVVARQQGASYEKPSKLSKPVAQYNLEGQYITNYFSTKEAYGITGISVTAIKTCINKKNRIQAGGYQWKRYLGNNNNIKPIRVFTNKKKVMQLTLEGSLIKIHNGVKEAARNLNIWPQNIFKSAKNKSRSAGGFKWSYV